MANDWEHYKKMYMDNAIEEAKNRISSAEMCSSPIERIAQLELYSLYDSFPIGECKVHPQVIIGKYTVDFMVTYEIPKTNNECSIIIECDGHDFHEKTKEQVAKDKERDRFLTLEGYLILRYSGSEICEDPYRIVQDIKNIIYKYRGWV